jgi:hypothetical protein
MVIIPPKTICGVEAAVISISKDLGVVENCIEKGVSIINEHLTLTYYQYYLGCY